MDKSSTIKPTAASFAAGEYLGNYALVYATLRTGEGQASTAPVAMCRTAEQAARIARGLNTCMSMLLDMEHAEQPRFTFSGSSEPSRHVPLTEMLDANKYDEPLCFWLRNCEVGNVFKTGGATGDSEVRRVS